MLFHDDDDDDGGDEDEGDDVICATCVNIWLGCTYTGRLAHQSACLTLYTLHCNGRFILFLIL